MAYIPDIDIPCYGTQSNNDLCCTDILNQLDIIESKIDPNIIYVDRHVIITQYIEVRTVKYVNVPCGQPPRPDRVDRIPTGSSRPAAPIDGWVPISGGKFQKGPDQFGRVYIKTAGGKIYRASEWEKATEAPKIKDYGTGVKCKNILC